ncbi:MAG TPA: 3-deoxy-manno-octulosonate cytidylyltransferase, partial [Pyrinomonadaceae bacterium]|nr:3-deoxy-manno-octulosonate cytidylyltransferase [Pyrinomonadaceae bacterium]
MEQHGHNPRQNVLAVIPARFASTRLSGKLLLEIAGRPLIVHTLNQVKKARNVDRVIVATDDERIRRVVEQHGGEAVMTSPDHTSGSDRVAEVARWLSTECGIVANVQGDEPMIPTATIERCIDALIQDESADIATTSETITDPADVLDPNVVKVVTDRDSCAVYFSRSPIPFPRSAVERHGSLAAALEREPEVIGTFRKHTGLYAYRRDYLLKFSAMDASPLERVEMLEQLRALESGARIRVVEVDERSIGVDTESDFERVRRVLETP